ncbi:Organic cation transporter protein [Nymphon striatum]|nr:Organic cation transporter protein [Nymphon striatum]
MLNAVIKFHLSLQSASPAVSELSENLYVDDFLTGADSKDEAIELFQNTCRIMSTAGMNMCQWSCNNSEVLDAIQKIKAHKVCRFADQTKVLGLAWQRELDCFVFTNGDLMNSVTTSVPTKRTVLSLIARIFDPLGFITPLTIRGKILFQRIWQAGTGWDELLPADLQLVWTQWITDLSQLQNIEIPTKKAYGAIVYLKSGCNVSFVMSRSRVAPIKKVTLPRLELLAAVLASRLMDYVKCALKLPVNITTYCWSDSQIVLAWIKSSPNRWKTFICNRVTEIQQHTEPSVWRYCPGEYNPADLLTREFVCDISNNMLWWGGPKWLSEEQKGWPCSTFKTKEVPPDEINVCLNVTSNPIKPILDITKFNNYQKMFRVTAYLFRAISIMQKQPTTSKQISTEELNYVEFYWYRTLQQEFFYSEYCALRDGSCINSKSKLKDLHPIWDSSLKLMRLGGRLQYSDLPYSSIHPIIVPHKSYFAKLLILDCHRSHSHCGVSQLICIIRERLWLSRLRSLAKSVVRVCVICRRVNQRACHEIAAPLPSCRINPSPPFNVVGIDFCGPLLLKGSRLKHYVCLFTCATTRAIHLELVDSLKTEEFLLCFRRFMGRRNVPSIIISDNAATFVKASQDSFITSKRIKWRFIVPRAPWWGGFWERLVRTTKTCLKKVLGNSRVTKKEFLTVLCEVESIINHRPLTYVSEDSEGPCALTPASFLTGASTLSFRDYSAMIDSSAEQLRIRKKHCDKVLDHIWSRWKKEYLLSLPTCVSKFSEGECLKIGAVVLIREDNVPRPCWKLGRVLELIRGRDDGVRAAWDLTCGKRERLVLSMSIFMAGFLVGVYFFGVISDRFGRKVSIMACIIIQIISSTVIIFSVNFYMYVVLRFFIGASGMGLMSSTYILLSEFLATRHRYFLGIAGSGWQVGEFVLIALAYNVRGWKYIQIGASCLALPFLLFFWIGIESPKWLISQQRYEDAKIAIKKYAKMQGKEVPESLLQIPEKEKVNNENEKKKLNPLDLFRTPKVRLRMIVISIIWFFDSLIAYAISLGAKEMPGNIYVNFALLSTGDAIGVCMLTFSINYFNRVLSMSAGLFAVAILLFSQLAVSADAAMSIAALAMCGRFVITMTFGMTYVFTAELFPTPLRSSALGTGSMFSRVGGILSPFVATLVSDKLSIEVWRPLPILILGCCGIIGGIILLILPDTFNKPLPETVEEIEKSTKSQSLAITLVRKLCSYSSRKETPIVLKSVIILEEMKDAGRAQVIFVMFTFWTQLVVCVTVYTQMFSQGDEIYRNFTHIFKKRLSFRSYTRKNDCGSLCKMKQSDQPSEIRDTRPSFRPEDTTPMDTLVEEMGPENRF